ncbi:MAG: ABC transporter ATP-binding protein [Devosia sp.]
MSGPRIDVMIDERRDGDDAPLFDGLSFAIEPATVVALVGPAGVGKSTLLRLIAGIDTSFTGAIEIGGTPTAEAPLPGFVFADTRLLPWLTARDNLRAVRPETTIAEADALLMRVGLAAHTQHFPHQLPDALQRRVALARAQSMNPNLLLLDEPFATLDRTRVSELEQLLLTLIETGHPTVLLATQLPEDAAALADRAIVLTGRPARITADYRFATPAGQRTRVERELIAARLLEAMGG